MKTDIETRFITLIGMPLRQSFAARMQNAAYEAMGLNLQYFYTEAGIDHLKEIVDGIRYNPSFIGCAVTKPNKVEVLKYLDEVDPLCKKMGACNTVVKKDGNLIGYNTDGIGFYRSITEDAGLSILDKTFFCFGAGGAGHAICSILAYYGAKEIYVTDMFSNNTNELVNSIDHNYTTLAKAVDYKDFSFIEKCDVIINASGIGMGRTIGESPLPIEFIRNDQFYFDACYNPDKTQFLLNAEEKGCSILNGLGMSLYQGAKQIELWTGKQAPIEVMRKELMDIISGR
ncbi:MAG: shikimate dehydrogenase [Erysipelotrichaceae bacterium]|nr:shikimate dehydrogenase [Erysipelotrichaceae bacterium]